MRRRSPRPTRVPLLAVALAVLLPAAAHGYINAGFRSQKEYDKYLEEKERIRNPVTAEDFVFRAGRSWGTNGILEDYTQAIRLDPSLVSAYLGRGYVYWRQEEYARAVADFEEAWRRAQKTDLPQRLRVVLVAFCPDKKTELAQRLLVIYAFCPDKKLRNPAKAVEMAREVARAGSHVELLAETLARAGDFKGAAREQARFLDMIRQKNFKGPVLTQAEQRLEAYQQGRLPQPHPDWQRLGLPLPEEE